MLASKGADPCLGPGVAASGPLAEAIQRLGDAAVRQLAGQSPDQVADRRVRAPAMLSRSVAGDGETSVIAAPPVEEQFDVLRGQLHNDLFEDGAHDSFPRLCCRTGMGPGRFEIGAKRQQAVVLRGRQRLRVGRRQAGDPFFLLLHVREAIRRAQAPVLPMGSRAGFDRSAQTRWPSVTTQPGSHHRVPSWFMPPPSHRRRSRLSPASRGGVPSSASLPWPPLVEGARRQGHALGPYYHRGPGPAGGYSSSPGARSRFGPWMRRR